MALINTTVGNLLHQQAIELKEKEAAIFVHACRRFTWIALDHEVNRIAKGLIGLGIKKRDHVGMWGVNQPEWLLTQLAVARIGAVLVTINPEWQADELAYALKQSDCVLLIMIAGVIKGHGEKRFTYDYVKTLEKASPDIIDYQDPACRLNHLPRLRHIVVIGNRTPSYAIAWSDFVERGQSVSNGLLASRAEEVKPTDTVLLQYTSGTTGYPKGAMLTHYNVLNNAKCAAENLRIGPGDRLCGPVPFYHCFGSILVNLLGLVSGMTLVIPEPLFDAKKTLAAIEKERCTVLHGVPSMFQSELTAEMVARHDLSSLRTGIMAGSHCPVPLLQAVIQQMGVKEMSVGYGLTEASPLTHQTVATDPLEKRLQTVGRPIQHTQARIVDPESHRSLVDGAVGEIWVKGFHVMQGYYKNAADTKSTIVDGWLRTGDLGIRDREGYLRVVGRLKEMFIVGGHNVYPAEVEKQLYRLFAADIESLQVVGLPDAVLQEVTALVVQLKQGVHLTAEEIQQRCRGKMEWPKIPRYVHFVADFSQFLTVTGKVQKYRLRDYLIEKYRLELGGKSESKGA